jgi:restriction endonuclease S subunit
MTLINIHIKDCAVVLPGFSAKGAIVDETEGTIQVITAQHLIKGEPYRFKEEHRTRIVPPRSIERYLLERGDILFMSRGANNYAVLLEDFPQPAIAPLTFFIIKPERALVAPEYLAWYLNQDMVRLKLNEIRTGAGTPMIPRLEFSEIEIPLPTMAVQLQIADLARFQTSEKALLKQLFEETERLHRLTGQQLLAHLTREKKE